MKIDIIFVHFAVVAAVAIPYIIFVLIAARERRSLKLELQREVKLHDLKLDEVDRWNSNIIGIDKTHQKVLLVQRRKQAFSVQLIDLKKVKSSILLHEVKTIKINKKDESLLQRVDLELSLYSGGKQVVNLFDTELTYFQDYEMKNAEKWNNILNEALCLRPLIHSAA